MSGNLPHLNLQVWACLLKFGSIWMPSSHFFSNLELLRSAKDAAEQKGLSVDVVISALESAMQSASKRKYGDCKVRAVIDKKTGALSMYRDLLVVPDDEYVIGTYLSKPGSATDGQDENPKSKTQYKTISLTQALKKYPEAEVGHIVSELLPPMDLDYGTARIAKQKVIALLRIEERKKQYKEFIDRVGDIVYGVVRRVERDGVILDLNGNEAFLPFSKVLPGENTFQVGGRVKACLDKVVEDFSGTGPQLLLSRVSKMFLQKLFEQDIPEVYDKIVVIKAIARDPGYRSKVAVYSMDKNVDPIGACVGVRGTRIQSILSEFKNEKIDVVRYSADVATFTIDALAPAEISKMIIDEENGKIEVVMPEDQISLAIGKKGQNIRLVSELVGWKMVIMSDQDEFKRRNQEISDGVRLFTKALNVDEMIAQLLVTEGYCSIEDIVNSSLKDIESVEGFTSEIAAALKHRASGYLGTLLNEKVRVFQECGMDDNMKWVMDIIGLEDMQRLAGAGIKTLEELAGMSQEDLLDSVPALSLDKDSQGKMIMQARSKLGWLD